MKDLKRFQRGNTEQIERCRINGIEHYSTNLGRYKSIDPMSPEFSENIIS